MIGFGYQTGSREAPLRDSVQSALLKLPAGRFVLLARINKTGLMATIDERSSRKLLPTTRPSNSAFLLNSLQTSAHMPLKTWQTVGARKG